MSNTIFLPTEAHTEALGACVAQVCPDGALIFLRGHLGTGKTTFSRGFVHALGYTGSVKSPTYTLIEPYEGRERTICHVDLYRLQTAMDFLSLGFEDYLDLHTICLIEWPEKAQGCLTEPWLILDIQAGLDTAGRTVVFSGQHPQTQDILDAIRSNWVA